MSARQVRKLCGGANVLPQVEGDSDEEFEPLYTKESKFTYAGLEIASNSESEVEESPEPIEEPDASPTSEEPAQPSKKKKNKKKKRKARRSLEDTSELDEIEKTVQEVNAMLGSPAVSPVLAEEKPIDHKKMFFSVQAKHLDFNNELKLKFGSDSTDNTIRGRNYRPHNVFKYKRAYIVPISDKKVFHNIGISMALRRRENDCSYFTIDHKRDYQAIHKQYVRFNGVPDVEMLHSARTNYHIEALLEFVDMMYRDEEYTGGSEMLKTIISCIHYAAHPAFNLTNQSVRLEYKYLENRPFFIAVLKYLYTLSNMACHRTALELAKLLLNLDPSDPLAVIYVIDVLALRAREHQWLVDVYDYWAEERQAKYLFNMQYSNAMAHFHCVRKKKGLDYSVPDKLLKDAMLLFPLVAKEIFEKVHHKNSQQVWKHPLFAEAATDTSISSKVKIAMTLHAKLAYWRWRERPVQEWFYRNAKELVDQLEADPNCKSLLEATKRKRYSVARRCPEQLLRHLHVVAPLTNLLVEWEMPPLPRQRSFDPMPPLDAVDRYGYRGPPSTNLIL